MYTSNHTLLKAGAALAVAVTMTTLSGCIKDDIPYPHIQPNFTEFTVEDAARSTQIDTINLKMTVYLEPQADIYAVNVTDYALTQGEVVPAGLFDSPVDLHEPLNVTVRLYQDYVWTITAEQTIDRYLTIENQIGASVIDVDNHTVSANVPSWVPITAVHVNSIALGGPNAVMTPDLAGQDVDFTDPVEVTVTEHGRSQVWTITVGVSESVVTDRVDAWTCVAWVYGSGLEGEDNGFEYRVSGSDAWVAVPAEWVTHDGGAFTGCLRHLSPLTDYEVRAVSGEKLGNVLTFSTGDNPQVPNASFDNWWLDGKIWCPWSEDGTPWWGTGNKGATTLGQSNTTPVDDTPTGEGKAAQLMTKFVGIGPLGKLAAGNIFAGTYVKTVGTNGILDFGRPFTERPTGLHGYFKYTGGLITHTSSGFEDRKGKPDSCIVWMALVDLDAPFEIRTDPKDRHLFDPDDESVIAYGEMLEWNDVTTYRRFDIKLTYKDTYRKPKYLLITASASKLGDYFTGCNGATMLLDDLVIDYDY
ncbi:MAG: PCMD domain-containing protein [Candidatus Amulumruptor caecigallinarius]|nr:PCMD domain-containing protein [Candidatus Amulumruptor caecigallinarius]MCM1396683.1 PCMD domain-containing protein [Candidatus Amulumruptor caecigallinarius]MCM1453259.1 PCMD domain-containing protein [bacterium]